MRSLTSSQSLYETKLEKALSALKLNKDLELVREIVYYRSVSRLWIFVWDIVHCYQRNTQTLSECSKYHR
ncbi:unnamed protein product [Schistosoma rodhaini]|uniref:Uncharacterized protein n=1 Tax=Schistosoma rodhaini TaxID=6188 RepID=A0AA85FHB5_9TREM|nr:unnamed protein product [Schistosoma rodhaini]